MISVRPAVRTDADAMSRVLIASITELCVADHGRDPERLRGWLANKTPDAVAAWFDNAGNRLFVAEVDGEVSAVGGINAEREVTLNYVAPAHRFCGVSTALLRALEAALGPGVATLSSTGTAREFYRRRGWSEGGPPQSWRGTFSYPMRKNL